MKAFRYIAIIALALLGLVSCKHEEQEILASPAPMPLRSMVNNNQIFKIKESIAPDGRKKVQVIMN